MAFDDKTYSVFRFSVSRRSYTRRVVWLLGSVLAVALAWLALEFVRNSGEGVDGLLLDVGQFVALALIVVQMVRLLWNLLRGLFTRSEEAKFYNRGFIWERGRRRGDFGRSKYRWAQVRTFHEGARPLRVFGRPLMWRGAQVLTMSDGTVFRFTARHGDPHEFARVIRPYIAEATGAMIGHALRNGKAVRLHPELALMSRGIVAGEHKIPWSRVDVRSHNGRIVIRKRGGGGDFETVKTFQQHEVANVPGLMDIAQTTMRNHQSRRERMQ